MSSEDGLGRAVERRYWPPVDVHVLSLTSTRPVGLGVVRGRVTSVTVLVTGIPASEITMVFRPGVDRDTLRRVLRALADAGRDAEGVDREHAAEVPDGVRLLEMRRRPTWPPTALDAGDTVAVVRVPGLPATEIALTWWPGPPDGPGRPTDFQRTLHALADAAQRLKNLNEEGSAAP